MLKINPDKAMEIEASNLANEMYALEMQKARDLRLGLARAAVAKAKAAGLKRPTAEHVLNQQVNGRLP